MSNNHISPVAAANIKMAQFILSETGTEESFEHFADDIILEFPYAPSLNMPDRLKAKRRQLHTYARCLLS